MVSKQNKIREKWLYYKQKLRPTFIACACTKAGVGAAAAVAKFIGWAGDAVKLVITPPETNGLLLLTLFLVAR